MPVTFPLFASEYFSCRHINLCRHSAAAAEEQVTTLLQRVKELTGMPDTADSLLIHMCFKSFDSCLCFLSSHSLNFKSTQMRKLHGRPATRTVRPRWMWPSSWTTGMLPTRLKLSS
jgi:hypothetical protein